METDAVPPTQPFTSIPLPLMSRVSLPWITPPATRSHSAGQVEKDDDDVDDDDEDDAPLLDHVSASSVSLLSSKLQ